MDMIDKGVLDKHFPEIKKDNKTRYDKDEILKVLQFMKEHPAVKLSNIVEYSGVSLGALVSWRKKYGGYIGIKTKDYSKHSDITMSRNTIPKGNSNDKEVGITAESKISLSLIKALQDMYESGSVAEIAIDNTIYKVDNQNLYILEKR